LRTPYASSDRKAQSFSSLSCPLDLADRREVSELRWGQATPSVETFFLVRQGALGTQNHPALRLSCVAATKGRGQRGSTGNAFPYFNTRQSGGYQVYLVVNHLSGVSHAKVLARACLPRLPSTGRWTLMQCMLCQTRSASECRLPGPVKLEI